MTELPCGDVPFAIGEWAACSVLDFTMHFRPRQR